MDPLAADPELMMALHAVLIALIGYLIVLIKRQ
jgi:hypothetical protein